MQEFRRMSRLPPYVFATVNKIKMDERRKGEDIIGAIHEFGKDGLIYEMHFRNVSSPLPVFHETFMDNGYIDMYAVVQALIDVDFNGVLVPDHVPAFLDEKTMGPIGVSGTPYSVGYMRALINRAYEEASIPIKV